MLKFLPVIPYRFIPPENFDLALLTLELELVKKGSKSEQVDAALLAKKLKKRFMNQASPKDSSLERFPTS
uniref:Uncharacterized protein n=1 Tax=Fagus sylvatica TaxID=28930 RepID=A0A2N9I0G2_FAGSY